MENAREGDKVLDQVKKLLAAAFCAAYFCLSAAAAPIRRSPYTGALAVDASNGRVLFSDRADEKAYPASVTKLMTAFIVLDDVKAGKLKLSDMVVASPVTSRSDSHFRQPSCVGLKPGESMDVETLLKVLLVHSANDSAVFLAEKCGGSVAGFVKRMNEKAKALGMDSTVYYNPNGLPPYGKSKSGEFNVSTCSDQAKLAMALLRAHPGILKYTSIKVLPTRLSNGKIQNFKNHNNVMVKDRLKIVNGDGTEAVDGLKTGYIDAGGSSVVLTGKRAGRRAIVVVLGSNSAAERDGSARHLMEDALDALTL